jgi:hypothetical protein
MQLLGIIVAALVIMAAAQALSSVIALLLLLLIVWGFYTRPFQTFGLLATLLLAVVVQAHPFICLLLLTGLAGISLLTDRPSRPDGGQPPEGSAGSTLGGEKPD